MYCLEKLQRELAYFFDMDLRELPRVQDLLTAKGYTQVQKGDEIIKLEPSAQAESTLAYTDTKGHTHQIPSDIAQKWLETFGLKDLQESYTPKFSEQVAQALEPILQGESIKLYAGSLIKLIKENRLQYLDRIQPTLEQPQRVILQNDGALIFARDFGDEKYFTSVARNDDGEWIIRSNAPKSESGLDNKIAAGGREIYNSQAATQINAHSPYDDIAKSNTKLDNDIIPQTAEPLSKQAQDYEKILNELEIEHDTLLLESEKRALSKAQAERLEMLDNELLPKFKALVEQERTIKIQNKALEYNKLLKELFILFDKNPAAFNEKFEVFAEARDSLIDTLARDFKVAHFIKQLFNPLKMDNNFHAAGFGYKTKKFRDDTLKVSGHMPTDSAIQKERRLSDMERERLQLAFAREYNIQDFLNDRHRQDFFTRLSDAVRNHFEFLHTYKTDVNNFLYTENRILPTDKITQAKQKLQKEREAFKEFLESNTAPKDTLEPTPPKVDSSDAPPSFTYTTGEAKGIAELRKDLKQALEPYKSTPITNKETGLQGVVTDTERNKISSKKAVDKSIANGFTRDEHFTAAQHLKNLFENATKAQSHNDYKQRENIAQVHRFVKDLYINDKQAQAKITLFEKIEGKNKIYTLELESLSPTPLSSPHTQAGVAVEAQVTRDVVRPNANIAKTDGESIAQDSNELLEATMQKFNYDERKAKDLLEWHKDSHPLTKDENGVPKVFYHGTSADELFEVFSPRKDSTKWGFWFASGEDYADHYGKGKNGTRQEPLKFSTFLKMKNPFDMTDDSNLEVLKKIMGKKEYEAAAKEVDFDHDNGASKIYRILSYSPFDRYKDKARAFQNKLKKLGYDGIKEQDGVMIVFEPNQIKHIENRGVAGQYFYSSSPNIFHSNPHAGAGLLGGSVAGVEQDENGNLTFSPEKFALGLLGGAGGSIAISKAKNTLKSSSKTLGETMTLKDRLVIDNKIKYSYLKEIAQDLPKPITQDDFLHLLKNKKYANIQTPIKELEIEPLKAYEHLTQNSNKQNRIDISGAILPTLQNPLFITKDKKDTYYFYKPFKDEKGVLNIVSIAIPKSNRIRYKTSYIASRERMLKMINEYDLIYEAF